jgi:hypothetical protein
VLSEFAADGYSFSFQLVDKDESAQDPGSILIIDKFTGYDRLGPLTEQFGHLTSLETFLAFAPEGQAPHPALVAAHEDEARAFGRSDVATVLHLDGRNLPLEKAELSCPTSLYPLITPLKYSSKEVTTVTIPQTQIYLCTGSPPKVGVGKPSGCTQHPVTKYQVAIACSSIRSREPAEIYFYDNRVPSFNPQYINRTEFVRYQKQPSSKPSILGRSLAVTAKNGPNTSNLTFLYTGVGEL